jgi:hypothetical protein
MHQHRLIQPCACLETSTRDLYAPSTIGLKLRFPAQARFGTATDCDQHKSSPDCRAGLSFAVLTARDVPVLMRLSGSPHSAI